MKKFLTIALITSLAFTSCTTIYKSVSTQQITSSVTSAVTADLDVSEKKITYDYYHTNGGGLENAKNCAVSQALKQHVMQTYLLLHNLKYRCVEVCSELLFRK